MPGPAILLIAKGFPPDDGGIETYSCQLARAYGQLGSVVQVVTSHRQAPFDRPSEFGGFISASQGSQLATALRMLAALLGLRLSGYRPQLVHATSWRVAAFARLLWPGARLAITVHGTEAFAISPRMRQLARKVLATADRLIFVSEPIRQKFALVYPGFDGRTIVAWNGCTDYAPDASAPARENGAIFTLCRLVERKNVRSAILAMARLRDRGMVFHYRIAGTGPQAEALAALIAQLGLEQFVELLGFVPDRLAAAEYGRAAIFLHPQIECGGDIEGFGIAIADAMRFGAVPVVGDNGGPTDFITDGDNGYAVDGLDVDRLADTLERLLTDTASLQRMSASAKDFASRNFSWTAHVAAIQAACGIGA